MLTDRDANPHICRSTQPVLASVCGGKLVVNNNNRGNCSVCLREREHISTQYFCYSQILSSFIESSNRQADDVHADGAERKLKAGQP